MPRHRNNGLRKRCGCPRKNWTKCPHPWHFNFKWRGRHYRFSLTRELRQAPTGKTQAQTEAERLRTDIRAGTFRSTDERARVHTADAITLDAFSELFLARYVKARGKKSWEDDAYMMQALCGFGGLGQKALGAITADDGERFLQHLRDSGRAGSTYNHYRQLLLVMFRWATRKAYLSRNPFEQTELPRLPQAKRSRRLTNDEEENLLKAATPRIYRLIVAALETGCRLGELLGLRWQDINLERRELRVRAEHAKDAEERVLPISTRLRAVLEMAQLDPEGEVLLADAFAFGDEIGRRVSTFKNAWHVTLLKAYGHEPEWKKGRLTAKCQEQVRQIDCTSTTCAMRLAHGGWRGECQFIT